MKRLLIVTCLLITQTLQTEAVGAECAPVSPSVSQNIKSWCELAYFLGLKEWEKHRSLGNINCEFTLGSDGQISNVHLLQKSNSSEDDDLALHIVQGMTFSKQSLWPSKSTVHQIVAQFKRYPELRLLEKDENTLMDAYPDHNTNFQNSSKTTDMELLNCAFDHTVYPLALTQAESWESVSCSFNIARDGVISQLRILKPTGITAVDTAALTAISGENPPFEHPAALLSQPHDVIVNFYRDGALRVKLKEKQGLIPIGPSGELRDPPTDD